MICIPLKSLLKSLREPVAEKCYQKTYEKKRADKHNIHSEIVVKIRGYCTLFICITQVEKCMILVEYFFVG